MKKKLIKSIISIVPMGLIIIFTTCDELDSLSEKGRKAADEFCDCYKNNSKEDCLENLKDKYTSFDYKSDDFITAFNEASDCGIQLELISE
ncbi:MAG: hypothetical protein LBU22_15130 [Dysgonamonadaceae bacterium]|jgi:hypothetical protein|nr:hypothetical protein [Dysgonamonadaceae bacterium]